MSSLPCYVGADKSGPSSLRFFFWFEPQYHPLRQIMFKPSRITMVGKTFPIKYLIQLPKDPRLIRHLLKLEQDSLNDLALVVPPHLCCLLASLFQLLTHLNVRACIHRKQQQTYRQLITTICIFLNNHNCIQPRNVH